MRFASLFLVVASAAAQQPLTLQDAERLAIQQHPRLRSAQLLTAASRAQVQQVKGTMQPFVAGSITGTVADHGSRLGAGGLNAPDLFSRFASGFSINQTLYDFGRTSKLADSVSSKADAQASTQDTLRSQILWEVRQAYLGALAIERALSVARAAVKSRELSRRQIQALVESQLRSTLDLQFSEVLVSDAEVTVARMEGELTAAYATLATAMGYTEERSFALAEVPDTYDLPENPESLVKEAMQLRPEVVTNRHQLAAAKQFAESERRLFYPSVSAAGVFGFIPEGDPRLRTRYGGVGLNLNIPVLNGKTFQARKKEADARSGSAEQDIRDTELRVAREVRTAFAKAVNAKRRIELSEKQLAQSKRLFGMAQARYKAGLGTIVEVNQAELSQLSAELGATSARYEYVLACGALDYASGRLR